MAASDELLRVQFKDEKEKQEAVAAAAADIDSSKSKDPEYIATLVAESALRAARLVATKQAELSGSLIIPISKQDLTQRILGYFYNDTIGGQNRAALWACAIRGEAPDPVLFFEAGLGDLRASVFPRPVGKKTLITVLQLRHCYLRNMVSALQAGDVIMIGEKGSEILYRVVADEGDLESSGLPMVVDDHDGDDDEAKRGAVAAGSTEGSLALPDDWLRRLKEAAEEAKAFSLLGGRTGKKARVSSIRRPNRRQKAFSIW